MRIPGPGCAAVALSLAPLHVTLADEHHWPSIAVAEEFLAQTLPLATRSNPAYLTRADGTVSEWFTDGVTFASSADGSIRVSMSDSFTQTRAGARLSGKHEASFALADVDMSELTDPADVTPAGEPARGVLFACKRPGCVAARWNGAATSADRTDVSVQDDASREKILAAFHYLKALGK